MPTIRPLHCFECPIRDHCPHNAFLQSLRLLDPGITAKLTEERRTELFVEDLDKIKEAIENCPLLKIMRS